MLRISIAMLIAALSLPLAADDIVVREVGGLSVIKGRIRHGNKQIEAHMVFDIGSATPLVIHQKSVGGLGLAPEQAADKRVDLEFDGGIQWKGIPIKVAPVDKLEQLTADYATDLKEIPAIAIIGLPAVRSSAVELNLREGSLRTMGTAPEAARARRIDCQPMASGLVFDATGPGKTPVKVLLSLQNEDPVLDIGLLESARRAGEKPNRLDLGGTDFGEHAAFRFQRLAGSAPGAGRAILGTSALRNFTITVWPEEWKIAFVPLAEPEFPEAEQAYFLALADRKPDGVAAFIATSPRRRLMDEACIELLKMRLADETSTPEALDAALVTISSKYESSRRSAVLAMIADQFEAGKRADRDRLVGRALELVIGQADSALDQSAVQGVRVRLGRRALAADDLPQARRHLLSAAFGMPKDGECNFWLGELYRRMEKPQRAWSRYFQAILDPDLAAPMVADCMKRLDELNRDPDFRKDFTMVVAEQYMAGRLEDLEFHAPTRHALEKDKPRGHVRLVEFFTDATKPANGGPQLAFQALDEYFEGAVAMISYHLNDPLHSEVAVNRRAYYSKDGPVEIGAFDGKPLLATNASKAEQLSRNAAANFPGFREASLWDNPLAEPEWSLAGTIEREGMKVSGVIKVAGQGAAEDLRLHAILCESPVMAPEASGVFFHHFVARRALTPPDGLELQRALGEPLAFEVDAAEMRESLTRMLEGDGPARGRSRPTYVDPGQLTVVAFVQRQKDRMVLAAKTLKLPQDDDL